MAKKKPRKSKVRRNEKRSREQRGGAPRRRAVLLGPLAEGDRHLKAQLRRLKIRAGHDLLIGVDQGSALWLKHGFVPSLAVGDWDSLKDRRKLREFPHVTLSTTKDASDFAYALRAAISAGVTEVLCLGLTGGRPDHHLAVLMDLVRIVDQPGTRLKRVWALGPEARYEILTSRLSPWRETVAAGQLVSVIPLGEVAHAVTISGLKYSLSRARLMAGSHGLSNEGLGKRAEVRLSSGRVVVIIPFEGPYGE